MKRKMLKSNQMPRTILNIVSNTCDYLMDHPDIKSMIIGLSGGADSALVSMLAREVCYMMKTERYGKRNICLHLRGLPTESNTFDERKRANNLGKLLDPGYLEIPIDEEFNFISKSFCKEEIRKNSAFDKKVRLGNIKARLRMIYLYNLASIYNGMVLSTDNYTELLLGFWTLHGDVGDYGMIQNLWKTEVFLMLDEFVLQCNKTDEIKLGNVLRNCRNAVPTDGLGITESDIDQFGGVETYEEVDNIFLDILTNGYSKVIHEGGEVPKILSMYEKTMYKRTNPFNLSRKVLIENPMR
jgi:NAD+ synthase